MTRFLCYAGLLSLLALSLAGCVDMRYHVTLNRDGSADLEYRMGVDSSVLAMAKAGPSAGAIPGDLFSRQKEETRKGGFTVADLKDGNLTGFTATKHIADAREAQQFLANQMQVKDGQAFTVKRGIFTDTYHLNAQLSMGGDSFGMPAGGDAMMQAMLPQLAKQFTMKFALTTPNKAKKHNATSTADEGRTLEWTLTPGQDTALQAEVTVPKPLNIALGGVTGLAFLGLVLGGIFRKRR